MSTPQKDNSNSKLLESLITKSPAPSIEHDGRGSGTTPVPVEVRERSIAAEILAESSRKRPEARVTMTIHLPQSLAQRVEGLARKANLSRNEFVKLVLEKATT